MTEQRSRGTMTIPPWVKNAGCMVIRFHSCPENGRQLLIGQSDPHRMGLLSIGNRLSSAVLAQSGPACTDLPEYQAIKGQGRPAPAGTWAGNNGVGIVEGDG